MQERRASKYLFASMLAAVTFVIANSSALAKSRDVPAEQVLDQMNQSNVVPTPAPQAASTPSRGSTSAPTTASGSGSSDAAQKIMGVGMSVAVGGYMASQCPKPCSMCCAMAAMSFAQAGMMLMQSGGSRSAGDAASNYGGYTGPTYDPNNPGGDPNNPGGPGNPNNPGGGNIVACQGVDCSPSGCTGPNCTITTGTNGSVPNGLNQIVNDYNKLKNALAAKGVSISKDGENLKLANGKTVPMSSLGTAEGMKAAGFGDSDIAAGMAAAQQAGTLASARMKGLFADGAGGGGGGGSGAGGGSTSDGYGGGGRGFDPNAAGKGKGTGANVSGMSKKLGNDRIGVSGDNIFEMIKRRYKARDEANNFIKD